MTKKAPKARQIELALTPISGWQRGVFEGFAAYAMDRLEWSVHVAIQSGPQLPRLSSTKPDAIISITSAEGLKQLVKKNTIGISLYEPILEEPFFAIIPHWKKVAELAIDHLQACGLRKMYWLHVEGHPWTLAFGNELETVCKQRKLKFEMLPCPGNVGREWRKGIVKHLQDLTAPAGVIVEPLLTGLCTKTLFEKGFLVPEQIAVLSIDESTFHAVAGKVQVSAIELSGFEAGQRCGKMLDDLFAGRIPARRTVRIPPKGLIERRSTAITGIEDPVVAYALAIINRDPLANLQVPELAQKVGVSHRTLCLRFQKSLGRSPKSEILRMKMEHAKELLRDHSITASEVAARCGFDNTSQFFRDFKKIVGFSPKQWRNLEP